MRRLFLSVLFWGASLVFTLKAGELYEDKEVSARVSASVSIKEDKDYLAALNRLERMGQSYKNDNPSPQSASPVLDRIPNAMHQLISQFAGGNGNKDLMNIRLTSKSLYYSVAMRWFERCFFKKPLFIIPSINSSSKSFLLKFLSLSSLGLQVQLTSQIRAFLCMHRRLLQPSMLLDNDELLFIRNNITFIECDEIEDRKFQMIKAQTFLLKLDDSSRAYQMLSNLAVNGHQEAQKYVADALNEGKFGQGVRNEALRLRALHALKYIAYSPYLLLEMQKYIVKQYSLYMQMLAAFGASDPDAFIAHANAYIYEQDSEDEEIGNSSEGLGDSVEESYGGDR